MLPELTSIVVGAGQTRRWLLAAGAVVLALALYCSGSAQGKRTTSVAQIDARRDTVMDTVRVVEERLRVDTVRVRETRQVAEAQRAAFDSAADAVAAIEEKQPMDTSIIAAMPAVHVCQQALAADTIAYQAVVANLTDMMEDRDAQRRRAEDDERELKLGRPRFGFRWGVAAGAAVVAVVVRIVR